MKSIIAIYLTPSMRISIIISFVYILYAACGNTSIKDGYTQRPADTVITLANYHNPKINQVVTQEIYRVARDSFLVVSSDTVGAEIKIKSEWRRDTIYYFPSLDTLRDNRGNYILDSTAQKVIGIRWHLVTNKAHIIEDHNRRLDSLTQHK